MRKIDQLERVYTFNNVGNTFSAKSIERTERREYDRLLDIRDNYPKYVLQFLAKAL